MLEITRYVNGVKVDKEDLSKYTVESDTISETINAVNRRLKKDLEIISD